MNARLMIIDDEAPICGSLSAFFEDNDFEARAFGSAEEALAALEHESFDVAIVDLRLPGMDGETFIIAAHEIRPELKYIIHTGSMVYQPGAQVRAIGLSQDDIYHKPVQDLNILIAAINKLSGGNE